VDSKISSCLKGIVAREFLPFSLKIWAPQKDQLKKTESKNLALLSL
jgi:hypothetical protein